jgi:glycosyltransferase involved in cell wall biosynthesis
MKICLVGPGIMTIPPVGWGAVEILIWDYFNELLNQGHAVNIVNKLRHNSREQNDTNSSYCQQLIAEINSGNYDFVHVHYDCLYHILPFLTCKKIGITSHYPYIEQPVKHMADGYSNIFRSICNNTNHTIFALSKKDYNVFQLFSLNVDKIVLMYNGANSNDITIIDEKNKNLSNKTIYLGKIEQRKCQHLYKSLPNVNFYGRCTDETFNKLEQYKGELTRNELLNILSNHGNMLLLSNGENGTPLVLKEALMAGLPIVVNKYSADDLDMTQPFIDIISEDKLNDLSYIENVVNNNRKKQHLHKEIRQYAMQHFSWEILVAKYAKNICKI